MIKLMRALMALVAVIFVYIPVYASSNPYLVLSAMKLEQTPFLSYLKDKKKGEKCLPRKVTKIASPGTYYDDETEELSDNRYLVEIFLR